MTRRRRTLVDLLSDRSIAHPTYLYKATFEGDELRLELGGLRWWRPSYHPDPMTARITFIFGGISDGVIRPDEFDVSDDEALEDFSIRAVADVPWAQPADWSIYCCAPLPDPLRVYGLVNDYLSDLGAFREARDFLNQADRLSDFVELAKAPSFLLASVPPEIRDLLGEELRAQDVPHRILETQHGTSSEFLVELGDSAFLCRSADAEFDDA